MTRRSAWLGMLALAAALLTPPRATAQIIYGDGETIAHVTDLPAGAGAQLGVGEGYSVGYKYWYAHIFWIAVWTSGGEFVAYQGDQYFPLDADADKAAAMCGAPKEALQVPLAYTLPTGWMVFGPILLLIILFNVLAARQRRKITKPPPDPRYATAVQMIAQGGEAAMPEALRYLVSQGMAEEEAKQCLEGVLAVVRWKAAKATKAAPSPPDPEP